MENVNYEEMLRDVEPSDQIVPYLMTQEMTHLTIYQLYRYRDPLTDMSQKMVRCVCSACGGEYLAEYAYIESDTECRYSTPPAPYGFYDHKGKAVINGGSVICPECGTKTEARYIGKFGGAKDLAMDGFHVQEIRKIDGHLTLIQWFYEHRISRDGREVLMWKCYNAFVVEEKKMVRLNAYHRQYYSGYFDDNFRQTQRCVDDFGEITHLMPWDKHILDGTPAENSKLDIYLAQKGCNLYPVSYLRLYLKHNNVENLMTCGARRLVAKMIESDWSDASGYSGRCNPSIPKLKGVNWRAVKPTEMLGIDKAALRRAIKEKWDGDMLALYRAAKIGGEELTTEELRDAKSLYLHDYADWIRERGLSVGRITKYLKRQKASMSYYRDYFDMVQDVGHDMTDPQVIRPKDLRRAHDNADNLRKIRGLREHHEQFVRRAKTLGKYAWESDGILIRPVADESELVHEGDALHHCVATYADRHCRAECAIFLIRRTDAPDEPWYTLDLNERTLTVNQNRGLRNCDRTQEVAAFEAAWIEHIRGIKTKTKKEKTA